VVLWASGVLGALSFAPAIFAAKGIQGPARFVTTTWGQYGVAAAGLGLAASTGALVRAAKRDRS
jgi:hypothetical protein